MTPLVIFSVLVGTALAAPQVNFKPVAYQQYQPLAYTPAGYPTQYTPAGYRAQYNPYYQVSPVYKGYAPAPAAPFVKPYVAPVAPFNKPVQPFTAQPYYSGQYVKPIGILRHSHDDNFDGSFIYDFESENGISNQASGYVKSISPEEQAQVMQGQYSYTAPDGTPIITRWYADETGFHAEGSHLPTAQADQYKTA